MKPIEEAGELFRHQRAVRAWSDREVSEEHVRAVLQAAIHAPSGSNTQPWRFIVVRDAEQKARIREVYDRARADISQIARVAPASLEDDRMPIDEAPVLIVACVRDAGLGARRLPDGIYPPRSIPPARTCTHARRASARPRHGRQLMQDRWTEAA